ncbi:MAG: HD domain-containing protein [Lachnospiraceae bacterium]|nr:HD domain-containing protein [Lachnospiraceae bacterium]
MYIDKIKNLKIIKKLKKSENGKEFYSKFEALVNTYAEILDSGAELREIGFTPHDFSHHCRDMYEILGIILPDGFYKKYRCGQSLFLLLVAVLFHDIGMIEKMDDEVRRRHSELGKEYILREINSKRDTVLKSNIVHEMIEPLGNIIMAHSDIKSESGEVERHTFDELLKKLGDNWKITVQNEEINIPFIAAVLRLTDELDISYERIENTGYQKKDNIESSKIHFMLCEYFKKIQRSNERPNVLKINIYDDKFNRLQSDSEKNNVNVSSAQYGKAASIAAQIIDRVEKIKKEFEELNRMVLSKIQYSSTEIWDIKEIELQNENRIREIIKSKRQQIKYIEKATDVEIQNYIENIVNDRKCVTSDNGVNKIDLEKLFSLSENAFIEPVSTAIKETVFSKQKTLVGLNYYGSIIASIIGYKYAMPFTYCFDDEKIVDEIEKDIQKLGTSEIVLITDVVESGKTICNLLDRLYDKEILTNKNTIELVVLFEKKWDNKTFSKIYSDLRINQVYLLNDTF